VRKRKKEKRKNPKSRKREKKHTENTISGKRKEEVVMFSRDREMTEKRQRWMAR